MRRAEARATLSPVDEKRRRNMSWLLGKLVVACLVLPLLVLGGAVLDRRRARARKIWSSERMRLCFPAALRGAAGSFAIFFTWIVLLWRERGVGSGGLAVLVAMAAASAAAWIYFGRQVQLDAEGVRLLLRFGRSRFCGGPRSSACAAAAKTSRSSVHAGCGSPCRTACRGSAASTGGPRRTCQRSCSSGMSPRRRARGCFLGSTGAVVTTDLA